jgi:hypothetical protein
LNGLWSQLIDILLNRSIKCRAISGLDEESEANELLNALMQSIVNPEALMEGDTLNLEVQYATESQVFAINL